MANGRRGNGEGSVYQRSDGRWCAQIQIGIRENGKPITKYFYASKRRDVIAKLDEYRLNLKQGVKIVDGMALDDYIIVWLHNKKKDKMKPASYDRLESTIKNNIVPRIGFYKLQDLTGAIIQRELIDDMKNGNESLRRRAYGWSSIKKAYEALNACLEYAVANRHLVFNPMKTVDLPSKKQFMTKNIKFFNDDEINRLIQACDARFRTGRIRFTTGWFFVFMLYTGLRMGEALALRWSDIDFEKRFLTVNGDMILIKNRDKEKIKDPVEKAKIPTRLYIRQDSAKSEAGTERQVPINKKAMRALLRLKEIHYSGPDGYIICTKEGNPVLPKTLQNSFNSISRYAGIEESGLHTLRHTFASLLFKKGIDVKVVSELLGHASISITYNTYIHLIKEQKQDAVELLDTV